MDFSVHAAFNTSAVVNTTWPNIRLFSVAEGGAYTPQMDVPRFVNDTFSPCWWWQTPRQPGNKVACNTWQVRASCAWAGPRWAAHGTRLPSACRWPSRA